MARKMIEKERTLKLVLQYEGTRYAGWQFQTNAVSIQDTVEKAVSAVVGRDVRIHGAGRTDAGVHALGQVAHFRTVSPIPPDELKRAINAHLPEDVAVREVREAEDGFHARFGAKGKTYGYTIRNHVDSSVLDRRVHWHLRVPLDVGAMEDAASCLRGRHDFRSFVSVPKESDTRRDLRRLEILRKEPYLVFVLEADGFLWKMVRRIVGSLVTVGRGKKPPSWVKEVLDSVGAIPGGPSAPACGLVLLRVDFGEEAPSSMVLPAPWPGFFLAGPGVPG